MFITHEKLKEIKPWVKNIGRVQRNPYGFVVKYPTCKLHPPLWKKTPTPKTHPVTPNKQDLFRVGIQYVIRPVEHQQEEFSYCG